MWGNGSDTGFHQRDLNNAERISILLEWWAASKHPEFASLAVSLATNPVGGSFSAWNEGSEVLELIETVQSDSVYSDFPHLGNLIRGLEDGLVETVNDGLSSDSLEGLSDAIERLSDTIDDSIKSAVTSAIRREFEAIGDNVENEYSESTLSDYVGTFKRLAPRAGISEGELKSAISKIEDRLAYLSELTTEAASPEAGSSPAPEEKRFDDRALYSLFELLTND